MCIGEFSEELLGGGVRSRDGSRTEPVAGQSAAAAPSFSNAETCRARLVRVIEGEIVPRLVLTRGHPPQPEVPHEAEGAPPPDATDVRELVRLLLAHDMGVALAYVETVRQRGATLDVVCLQLLAPAARELGLLWEEDECDFMQVTLALCRLHQVLRELSSEFRCEEPERRPERRILLALCPGEQHTFGISVVSQFLQRAGWDVWQEFPSTKAGILEVVRQNWFAVVGLSVGSSIRLEEIAATIRQIRATSRNREVGVLIGGPIMVARPELVELVGADGTASDGPQAVLRAEHFCSRGAAANR
jgi:methanogenic corrinoid protein MtbC1